MGEVVIVVACIGSTFVICPVFNKTAADHLLYGLVILRTDQTNFHDQ